MTARVEEDLCYCTYHDLSDLRVGLDERLLHELYHCQHFVVLVSFLVFPTYVLVSLRQSICARLLGGSINSCHCDMIRVEQIAKGEKSCDESNKFTTAGQYGKILRGSGAGLEFRSRETLSRSRYRPEMHSSPPFDSDLLRHGVSRRYRTT